MLKFCLIDDVEQVPHYSLRHVSSFPRPTGEEQPCLRREPKTTDAVRGQFYPVEKSKNRKDKNMKTLSSIFP